MFIKERWLPYVILALVILVAAILIVCETNRVSVISAGKLQLRFGESKVGTFEAAAIDDDRDSNYRLYVEKGGKSNYYDLTPNIYRVLGFTYGDGDYKVTLYRQEKQNQEKSNKVGEVTINTTISTTADADTVSPSKAETKKPKVSTSISYDAVWEMREYTHTNKKTIDYWINVPEGATSGMPIVIFLHGDGEMNKPKSVAKLRQVKYMRESKDFIGIAPVGKNSDWTSDKEQQALKGLIDDCIEKYQIDTNRVYIWGFSRGSIGTWGMVERYGSFFTAAVPISCGSYNGSSVKAENFKYTKIYALAGSKEGRYIKQMRKIVDSIVEMGGSAKFETVAGQTHETISKNFPYTQVIDNWLLKQ